METTTQSLNPVARHNTLVAMVTDTLSFPGKASSILVAYVHAESSLHSTLNILSKQDAERLLPQVEAWQATLKSIIEKGKL